MATNVRALMEEHETLVWVFQMLGTVAFAFSGVAVAERRGMDFFGALVLSVIVAVGGGTVRDVLLGVDPVFWIERPVYVVVALVAGMLGYVFARYRAKLERASVLLLADAAGLSVFVVAGTDIALGRGVNGFIAVLLGCITGIAGGMMRDVLADEIPVVLRSDFYATAAIAGAALHVVSREAEIPAFYSFWMASFTIFALRIVGIKRGWRLDFRERRSRSRREGEA